MVLDASLLNTQHYEVKWVNPGKEERPPLHIGVKAIEKGVYGSPSIKIINFTLLIFLELSETLGKESFLDCSTFTIYCYYLIWFDLVSLFEGISTFVGY